MEGKDKEQMPFFASPTSANTESPPATRQSRRAMATYT